MAVRTSSIHSGNRPFPRRARFLQRRAPVPLVINFGESVMRVKALVFACVRVAVRRRDGGVHVRFRARGVRFRTGPERPLSPPKPLNAVRSADGPEDYAGRGRADGAREQPGSAGRPAGPTDPDLCRRRGPRRLRIEPDVDHHQPERDLSSNRLPDDGADNSILSNDNFSTGAGIQQAVPWGGGRYTVGIDASRLTTNNPTNPFNPQLDSSLAASYTQPLAAELHASTARGRICCRAKRGRKSPTCSCGRR